MNNSETLKALMTKHNVSAEQVADMLNVSPYEKQARLHCMMELRDYLINNHRWDDYNPEDFILKLEKT